MASKEFRHIRKVFSKLEKLSKKSGVDPEFSLKIGDWEFRTHMFDQGEYKWLGTIVYNEDWTVNLRMNPTVNLTLRNDWDERDNGTGKWSPATKTIPNDVKYRVERVLENQLTNIEVGIKDYIYKELHKKYGGGDVDSGDGCKVESNDQFNKVWKRSKRSLNNKH